MAYSASQLTASFKNATIAQTVFETTIRSNTEVMGIVFY